jgi:iron complex outermembrane receptor protein
MEGQLIPARNLLLSGFYSFIDAHYDKNEFNGVDLRSIPFLGTPKHKLSISGTYTSDLPPGIGDVSFTAQYSYQSRVFFATPLIPVVTDPRFGQPGYSLVNLHADWKNIFGRPFDLTGFVTNLTNKSYLIFENESYNVTGFSTGIYGEPRMFGFEGRYHF